MKGWTGAPIGNGIRIAIQASSSWFPSAPSAAANAALVAAWQYKMVGIINGKTICKKSSLKTWWRSYIIYSISQITTIPNITAEVRNRCFASSPGGKRMADAEDITEHLVLVGQRKWCDLCAVEVRLYDEGLRGCSGWRRVNNGVMIASRRFAKQ